MRLRNQIGITITLQLFGAVATALTNVVIARRYGPVGQGYLISYYSAVLLISSAGLFGLPQAFVYLLNLKEISPNWAFKFSIYYSFLFAAVVGTIGWLLYITGNFSFTGLEPLAIFAIVTAASGLLVNGLNRAISLATKPIQLFNLISIIPSLLSFLIYLFWHSDDYHILVLVSVVASILSSLFSAIILREYAFSSHILWSGSLGKIRKAMKYGFWSYIPAVSLNLINYGTYGLLIDRGASKEVAGYFSISVLIALTASILPLNMIVPVLFNSWSKEVDNRKVWGTYVKLSHFGPVMALTGLGLGQICVEPLTKFLFGVEFLPSVAATKILLLCLFSVYQSRLLTAALLSFGKPDTVAKASVVKVVLILLPMYLGYSDSLTGAAWSWTVGEYASVTYMGFVICKRTGWTLSQVAGLSLPIILVSFKSLGVRLAALTSIDMRR